MRPQPPRGALVGLSLAKALLTGLAMALALGLGATVTDRADPSAGPSTEVSDTRVHRLMSRFQCSQDGFGSEVIPHSALIHLDGRVRHVSFDRGWASFTGDAPGTLMAVCRK